MRAVLAQLGPREGGEGFADLFVTVLLVAILVVGAAWSAWWWWGAHKK